MATELEGRELGGSRRTMLVETSGSGGGRWGHPGYLLVAVLPPRVPHHLCKGQLGVTVIDRVLVAPVTHALKSRG